MKKLFKQIILFVLLTSTSANAQLQDPILEKLIENKLIEQDEVRDFLKKQEEYKPGGKTSYIYGLFQSKFKKQIGHFYFESITDITALDDKEITEEEQKKENLKLTDYLSKLKKIDLISEKQFNYLQKEINNNSYGYELQFLKAVTNKALNTDYLAPERLKKFANQLKEYKIADKKYESLLKAIEDENIKEPVDLLLYCERSVIIDTKKYPVEPKKYLEIIHQQTASILPELAFTNFEFEKVQDDEFPDNTKCIDFIVSLRSNGRVYKYRSNYHDFLWDENKPLRCEIDYKYYYQIFNKILRDLHSAYRLHVVVIHDNMKTDNQLFGIIVLNEKQKEILSQEDSYLKPEYEDFIKKPTSQEIENAIKEFTKIGLFSNLTADELNKGKENAAALYIKDKNQILSAFPNMIYLDESIMLRNQKDPYAEIVKIFARISHNQFNPTHISNPFDSKKNKTTLNFKIGNKFYSKVLKVEDDWTDSSIFDFIKSVVFQNNLKGQFYKIESRNQIADVYLTKKQYDYIKANKLLSFDSEFTEEDEEEE
ncbi:hypothetical protein L1276_000689 [Flavobacterium sp. HSC-32F16]|uniref:hypothetical protein n=1 Tax=Flavobacterium sp. HSC-32F16 TaxID=2910964 RepID=UPI0020A32EF7|nr:hypothetical protein [Flavobacterium sp. HSC-32F16]MCP2025549.1 hypothetical protein [Flavobacterium sp. HSC-32F16]